MRLFSHREYIDSGLIKTTILLCKRLHIFVRTQLNACKFLHVMDIYRRIHPLLPASAGAIPRAYNRLFIYIFIY